MEDTQDIVNKFHSQGRVGLRVAPPNLQLSLSFGFSRAHQSVYIMLSKSQSRETLLLGTDEERDTERYRRSCVWLLAFVRMREIIEFLFLGTGPMTTDLTLLTR